MSEIILPQFRDQFEPSLYPFADTANLAAASAMELRRDVLIDATLAVSGNTASLRLLKLTVDESKVRFSIGVPRSELASGTFYLADSDRDVVPIADALDRPAGLLVLNLARALELGSWPRGDHVFSRGAEFAASCVLPMPEANVRSLALEDGDPFVGDVWLVGGEGVVVRADDGYVRVDVVGDPLFRRKACEPTTLFETPRFLRTLNYIEPNEFGDIRLDVGTHLHGAPVLRIRANDQGDGLLVTTTGRTA